MFKIVSLALLTLTVSIKSEAFPAYLQNFSDHYDFNGIDTSDLQAEESCGVCHVNANGGGKRNAYGNDFIKAVRAGGGFAEIEMNDSDGDGFSSFEEIFLNTAPGRVESAPASRIEIQEAGNALVLSFDASCANLKVKSFGVQLGLAGSQPSFDSQTFDVAGISSLTLSKSAEGGVVLASCENAAGSFGL